MENITIITPRAFMMLISSLKRTTPSRVETITYTEAKIGALEASTL